MPFCDRLDGVALPAGFKLPQFNLFDGNGDPLKHLKGFIAHMTITFNNPDVYAKVVLNNLTGKALDWETVLKKDRSRSPKKAPVLERIQHDRGQTLRKQAHSPQPPSRGLVRFSQHRPQGDHNRRTPLRVSVAEVFFHVQDKNLLPKPVRMCGAPGKRDKNQYCEYHMERGHDTNDCRILKAEIAKLIKRGYLKEFVGQDRPRQQGRGYSAPRKC
ncbi:hypothetical protein LIER_41468 [Lithospermum erythrorhizon]|uniref:Retrotransposon gag domain-containing protein n=1 Tax=Lithospermum erythrorhizon TaxID=34254 RepID=A0AAV3RCS6_LITER